MKPQPPADRPPAGAVRPEGRVRADAELMAAVAAGDETAFARLMQEEAPRLVRLAASLLSDPAEAEEVAQEALLRLWQAAPDWQPLARVGTWLYGVAYRLSIDRIRKRRPTVDFDAMDAPLASGEASPEEELGRRQRDMQIEEALARLSPRQRSVIVIAHFQGLSQAEGAAVLEISEEAYESLLARSRRRLKALVAGEGEREE